MTGVRLRFLGDPLAVADRILENRPGNGEARVGAALSTRASVGGGGRN